MKSNLLILIRSNFQMTLGSIRYSKKRGKYFASTTAIVLIYFVFLSLMGYNAYVTTMALKLAEVPGNALYFQTATAMLMAILFAVMRSGTSTSSKDADFMLSLPVKRITIIVSKTVSQYLFDLAMVGAIYLPTLVVYLILIELSTGVLLRGLLVMLLVPLISSGIAYLLSFFLLKVSGKMAKPELLRSALILVFLTVFIVAYYSVSGSSFMVAGSGQIAAFAKGNPLGWGAAFAVNGDIKTFLLFLLLTFVPFFAGTLLQASVYGVKPTTFRSKNKMLDFAQHTPLHSLILKEIRFYFSIPIYVVNTIIGPIFSIILVVALVIYASDILTLFPFLTGIILLCAMSFCIGMSCISASSISLEGKNIRILRASPVEERDIFLAKIAAHLVITAPVTVGCGLVGGILLGLPASEIILIGASCIALNLLVAVLGLLLNLIFPKLDWTSETAVVKRSMPVMICVFGGMLLSAFPAVLYFLLIPNVTAAQLIFLAILILLLLLSWLCLMNKGKRCYREL